MVWGDQRVVGAPLGRQSLDDLHRLSIDNPPMFVRAGNVDKTTVRRALDLMRFATYADTTGYLTGGGIDANYFIGARERQKDSGSIGRCTEALYVIADWNAVNELPRWDIIDVGSRAGRIGDPQLFLCRINGGCRRTEQKGC